MTNKDLISQYVDTGLGIPEYQYDKLSSSDKRTYLRKMEISIERNPRKIQFYYAELPEEKQLAAVRENAYMIRYIKNPSEQVQLTAVNEDGKLIEDILKKGIIPSEQVQMAAVIEYCFSIEYIEDPSEQVQMAAVSKNGSTIRYIKNPTDNVIALYNKLGGR